MDLNYNATSSDLSKDYQRKLCYESFCNHAFINRAQTTYRSVNKIYNATRSIRIMQTRRQNYVQRRSSKCPILIINFSFFFFHFHFVNFYFCLYFLNVFCRCFSCKWKKKGLSWNNWAFTKSILSENTAVCKCEQRVSCASFVYARLYLAELQRRALRNIWLLLTFCGKIVVIRARVIKHRPVAK